VKKVKQEFLDHKVPQAREAKPGQQVSPVPKGALVRRARLAFLDLRGRPERVVM
jgi:hypothetical protein